MYKETGDIHENKAMTAYVRTPDGRRIMIQMRHAHDTTSSYISTLLIFFVQDMK